MKKIILGGLLLIAFTACTNNQGQKVEERKLNFAEFIDQPTVITFEEMSYDFGTVKEGELVHKTFKFTNTGDKDLILINVKGSCGCTVPDEWPKQPIAPGKTEEIKVTFNSEGRVGNVQKSVRIEANTEPTVTTLTITGKVVEK
ncbi:MAG TPA: DUF1573 domain-containing protein [Crocinitomix sp.]|nr:DUF1573 domain-containing protein [Crocinitomix sp.]